MKLLPQQLRRPGYRFQQVFCDGNVAIYSQTKDDSEEPIAYEVIVTHIAPAKPAIGILTPYESFPGGEEWGARGWTCLTLQRAKEKAFSLLP